MDKKILCAGSVFADMLMGGVSDLPSHWEQTLPAKEAYLGVGGGAANSAITFGILGASCDFCGRVGNDALGKLVEEHLQECGVDTEHLGKDKAAPTGVAVGLVRDDGKRCFVTARGANQAFCMDDFETVEAEKYDYFHVNGYFQLPGLETGLKDIMKRFKKYGSTVTFDTASWDPSGRWYDAIKTFAKYIDYMFLNESQLMKMGGRQNVESNAFFLLEEGVKNVVVKQGENGCTLYTGHMPGLHVPTKSYPVCDTTGAGDSFDAAYIVGLRHGWKEEKCARFANTVAGLNCCRFGATEGVPDFQSAYEKMNEI